MAGEKCNKSKIRYITKDLVQKFLKIDSKVLNLVPYSDADAKIKTIQNLDLFVDLEDLNLSYNAIEKIENLGNLNKLTKLNLSNNRIEKLDNLNQLVKLKTLNLRGNCISRIPISIKLLVNLGSLDLSYNQLSVLSDVENLKPLKNLIELDLKGNQITEIPHWKHFSLFHLRTLLLLNDVEVDEEERQLGIERFGRLESDMAYESLMEARKRIMTLEVELKSKEAEFSQKSQDYEHIKSNWQNALDKIRTLEKQLALEKSMRKDHSSIGVIESFYDMRNNQEKTKLEYPLIKQLETLLLETENEKNKVSQETNNQLQQMSSRIHVLENELENYKKKPQLESEIYQLIPRATGLNAQSWQDLCSGNAMNDLKMYLASVAQLASEYAKLRQNVEELKQEREESNPSRLSEREKDVQEYFQNEEVKKVSQDIAEMKDSYNQIKRALLKKREIYKSLKSSIDKLQTKKDSVQRSLDGLQHEVKVISILNKQKTALTTSDLSPSWEAKQKELKNEISKIRNEILPKSSRPSVFSKDLVRLIFGDNNFQDKEIAEYFNKDQKQQKVDLIKNEVESNVNSSPNIKKESLVAPSDGFLSAEYFKESKATNPSTVSNLDSNANSPLKDSVIDEKFMLALKTPSSRLKMQNDSSLIYSPIPSNEFLEFTDTPAITDKL